MRSRVLIPSFLLLPQIAGAQAARPAYPQVTIPNTEVRALHSNVTGRNYDLYVYLPTRLEPGSGAPATIGG